MVTYLVCTLVHLVKESENCFQKDDFIIGLKSLRKIGNRSVSEFVQYFSVVFLCSFITELVFY